MAIIDGNSAEDNLSNERPSTAVKASEVFHDPDIKDVFAKFKPFLSLLPATRNDTIRRLPEADEIESLGEISDSARLFVEEESRKKSNEKVKNKRAEKLGGVRSAGSSSKLKKATFSETQLPVNGLQSDNAQEVGNCVGMEYLDFPSSSGFPLKLACTVD